MMNHIELVKYSKPQRSIQLPFFTNDGWMIIFAVAMLIGFICGVLVGDWNNEVIARAAGK